MKFTRFSSFLLNLYDVYLQDKEGICKSGDVPIRRLFIYTICVKSNSLYRIRIHCSVINLIKQDISLKENNVDVVVYW